MKHSFKRSLLASIALLPSCAKVDSSKVKSDGIYATVSVTGDATGKARCEASFQVGSETGTYLSLADGDRVSCDGQPMERTEALGMVSYRAELPAETGRSYRLRFTRPNEPEYLAEMQLPEPVEIEWPRSNERIAAGKGVELRWRPGATNEYDVLVSLRGPKASTFYAKEFPDKGSKLLERRDLEMPEGSGAENFTAQVLRAKAGSFPQGLAGGKSWGQQKRSVSFTVTP